MNEPWINDIHNWYLFTIRSWDLEELKKQRNVYETFGFIVEDIQQVTSKLDGIPYGWFTFRASIKKSKVHPDTFKRLTEWDEKWGNKTNK